MEWTATVRSSQRIVRILLRGKDEPYLLQIPNYEDELIEVKDNTFWVLHEKTRYDRTKLPVSGPFRTDDPRFIIHAL